MEQYSHRNFLATKRSVVNQKKKKHREETKQGKTFNVARNKKKKKSFVTAAITKKMGNEVTHCVLFLFLTNSSFPSIFPFCCCLPFFFHQQFFLIHDLKQISFNILHKLIDVQNCCLVRRITSMCDFTIMSYTLRIVIGKFRTVVEDLLH
ncbi:hypothetical protein ACKWTF_009376 [Chironomus riparius]